MENYKYKAEKKTSATEKSKINYNDKMEIKPQTGLGFSSVLHTQQQHPITNILLARPR